MTGLQKNPWVVLVVLCTGFFMILLDLTIVNIAIPSILKGLHATLDQILWVLNGYILSYAVLLITAGRLGDLYGQKRLFQAGMLLFTLASGLCGFAQDSNQLIAARVLQGVGGAVMTPQTLAILVTIFPPERRGAAFGVWGGVAGIASVTGPTLGGFIVTYADWRWIFYVNLPIGALALLAGWFIIPDLRPGRRHGLDLAGVVLASAGLFAVVFGLIEGQRYDWGAVWGPLSIAEIIGAGVALIAIFVWWESRQREPLMPLSLFRERNFSLMNWTSAALNFGMLGIFLPFIIYLQSVLGMTPLQAGLTMMPMSLLSMPLAPIAGRLSDRIGGKYILLVGLTLFAASTVYLAGAARTDSTWLTFLPGVLLAGAGMGCTFAPMVTVAMRNIQPQMAGAASGVMNTVRQLGGALGGAIVGAVLQNRLASTLHDEASSRASALPPQFQRPFVNAFDNVARSGFELGRGQSGAALPSGIPPSLQAQLQQLFHDVFVNAYVSAMRPTMAASAAVLLLAALSCLAIRRRRGPAAEVRLREAPAPAA